MSFSFIHSFIFYFFHSFIYHSFLFIIFSSLFFITILVFLQNFFLPNFTSFFFILFIHFIRIPFFFHLSTLSLSLSLHLTSFILTFLSFSPFTDTHTSSFFLRQHLPLHVHFLNASQTDFLTTAGILQFSSQFCPCQVFPPFVHLSSTTS